MSTTTPQYQIGIAAKKTGLSAAKIRFYEKEKLIAPRGLASNNYRMYNDADLHQLRFIRQLRAMDMSLDEVRLLLGLDLRSKADCQSARDALDEHIGHVKHRLNELKQLEKELVMLRARCDGTGKQCHIIEALNAQADAKPAPTKRVKNHLSKS